MFIFFMRKRGVKNERDFFFSTLQNEWKKELEIHTQGKVDIPARRGPPRGIDLRHVRFQQTQHRSVSYSLK
jgi:hypothetical protein